MFLWMERDKYFSSLLYIAFARDVIISFPLRPRKPCMANDFRTEAEDGKVLSALCKYCPEVKHNDLLQEARSRNNEGSAFYLDLS